jgi:hypothetical protein
MTRVAEVSNQKGKRMKKILIGTIAALFVLSAATVNAFAAPAEVKMEKVGPYEGTFHGVVYGDNGSSAPLTLDLTHRGAQVQGNLALGSGLYVKGGVCGGAYVPSGVQFASGNTAPNDPKRLVASTKVDVGRFDITVKLESSASTSGDTINAKAKLDLPWFCGRDPVLNATLYKSN